MQRVPHRRFTGEFKSQAVTLAESIGPAKAARQLDMSVRRLVIWLAAARAGKPLSSPSRTPVSALESAFARPRAENATLKMEREILKQSDGVLRQGVQVKYALVARERARFPLDVLCRLPGVARLGFYG